MFKKIINFIFKLSIIIILFMTICVLFIHVIYFYHFNYNGIFMERFEEEIKKRKYFPLSERNMLFFQDWAQYAHPQKCYNIKRTTLISEVLCEKDN